MNALKAMKLDPTSRNTMTPDPQPAVEAVAQLPAAAA